MTTRFLSLLILSVMFFSLNGRAQTTTATATVDLSKCRAYELDMDGTETAPMWYGTIWINEDGDIVKCLTRSYKGTWKVPTPGPEGFKDYEMKDLSVDGNYNPATGKIRVNVYHQPSPASQKVFLLYWDGEYTYMPSGQLVESAPMWIHESKRKAPASAGKASSSKTKKRTKSSKRR